MVSSLALKRDMENIPQIDFVDMPEDDLRWSSISLKEVLERKLRLEASVFDIEGRHAREVLKYSIYKPVPMWSDKGPINNAYYFGRFKRIYVDKQNGVPFYLPSQINELHPKPDKYISTQSYFDTSLLKLKEGTILMTRSGTIGNCTIVTRTFKGKMFSDDVIRIELKDEKDLGYVYSFLKSKIGRTLINTNNYGAVIQHIEPEHLVNIPIPNANASIKANIHEKIISSFELRDQSNELIDKAERLLIDELNLPPIEELKPVYFDKNSGIRNYHIKLSELNLRFDGSYHVPIVKSILGHLKKYSGELATIGDKRISQNIILPGRFKRVYVSEGQGTVFFGGKQIGELAPSTKKYLSINHKSRIDSELVLKENTVLITRSGTIGKVTITPKHWENWVINEHVIRIIPIDEDMAGYIYSWLSTDYGYELITRFTYGAVVDEIDDNHVAQIPIPLLKNKEIQNKINKLVLEANSKRHEAYLLEQKAIQLINDKVIFNSK